MKNRYTYEVHTNKVTGTAIPLHVVEIKNQYVWAFSVFSTSKQALEYIMHEKKRLAKYGAPMEYDPNMHVSPELLDYYLHSEKGYFTKLEDKEMYIRPNNSIIYTVQK